jgi:hypothetical protein
MIQDDELSRLFLMAGLGMIGAPNLAQGVSRGGMFALQDLDQQREYKTKKQLADAKLREEELQAKQREIALARAQRLQGIYGGAGQSSSVQPAGSQRSVVDAPGWNPQVAPAKPQDIGDMLLREGFVDEAEKYAKARGALHGEAYGGLQMTQSGKPYYMTKQGPRYAADNSFVPREELHFGDTGDRTSVGFDKFTGQVKSQGVAKGLSPAERDASARGWANFNLGTYDQDRGGYAGPKGFTAIPGGMPGGKGQREDADNLRKEFNALPAVKNYMETVPMFNAASRAPDTPAGDFALIYGVGKVLDPGSVVREGEMNMVIASGSPAQRVSGYLNFLQGNGRLTPAQRGELQEMLLNATTERQALYNQARQSYGGIAQQRGYKPEDIFVSAPEVSTNFRDGKSVKGAVGKAPSGAQVEAAVMAELERRRKAGGN